MSHRIAALCLGAALVAAPLATAAAPAHAADTLRGTTWHLTLPGYSADQTWPASFTIATDGSVKVNSTCNSVSAQGTAWTGRYTIAFPSLATTRMLCEGARGAIESSFLSSLENAYTYTLRDGQLVLTNHQGASTTFVSRQVSSTASIVGSTWKLSTTAVPAQTAAQATFTIAADGTLTATSPCNSLFANGTATVNGSSVTFPGIGSTRMMCEGAPMTAESLLVKALSGTSTFAISGDTLVLTAANGTRTTFVR